MASSSRQKYGSSGSRKGASAGFQSPRSQQARGFSARPSSNNSRYANASRSSAPHVGRAQAAPYEASSPGGRTASGGPSSGGRVTSVRLGDMGGSPQGSRPSSSRSGGGRRSYVVIALALVLVCAFVVGGLFLANSSFFKVSNVEVKGSEHLTEADMNALAPIPEGTALFAVDTEMLERSIERDAWVEDAQVKRKFPSTVEIVITEREIGAVVEVTSADAKTVQPWAIAADGMWLMAIPDRESEIGQMISPQIYESADAVLHITDVPYGIVPEMGTYCTDDNVNNALAIVEGMTTDLADRVKVVSATDAESTLLTLDSGVEIAFGTAEDIRDKERICLELMEQYPGQVAYINVRVIDRPTWRSI